MKGIKVIVFSVCLALFGAVLLPRAGADEWDKSTKITFSGPVELPNIVLPAGTYFFRLLDSESDRDIVQIFNEDRTKLYTTIIAIPDYRLEPTGKTVISFEERAANSPEALRAWFYPGDNFGLEFVYPKPRAIQLAKANRHPVPAMSEQMAKSTSPEELKKTPVKNIQPSGGEEEIASAPAPKALRQPAPETSQQPLQAQMASATPVKELPKTASPMPLVGLLGLLALSGGAFLLYFSKKLCS